MQGGYEEEADIPELVNKDKKTLIPLTNKIFNDSIISSKDNIEYKNIPLFKVLVLYFAMLNINIFKLDFNCRINCIL